MGFPITWSPLGDEDLLQTAKWHPEPLARGTLTILTASLITMSLCAWTTLHLNIPPHDATFWIKLRRKLKWLFVGIVLPEYVLFVAGTQWLAAQGAHHRILSSFAEQGLQEAPLLSKPQRLWRDIVQASIRGRWRSEPLEEDGTLPPRDDVSRDISVSVRDDIDIELGGTEATPEPPRRRNPWTIRHTHYVQMGGFVCDPSEVFNNDDSPPSVYVQEDLGTRLALTVEAVVFLSKSAPDLVPDISEAYITDKSNADSFSRVLAILQASWFLVQFITRLSVGLPATILELNVVAHIVFAVLVFVFWWKKPLDIGMPTEVHARSSEDRSLLAAMYIRSRIGYMRRVDDFESLTRAHHTAFLDLAPVTSESLPRQELETEDAAASNGSLYSDEQYSGFSTRRSFQILLGQKIHGIHVVACSHHDISTTIRLGTYRSPTALLGDHIVLEGHSPKCCSKWPAFPERAPSVTISDARRRVFELARSCEHLGALGVPAAYNESAVKAYLERVCRAEAGKLSVQALLRRDFLVEPPSDLDVEGLGVVTANLLFGLFFYFSTIFGVLHLLAWNGPFRTRAELVLWRIAATALIFPLAGLFAWPALVAAAFLFLLLLSPLIAPVLVCVLPRSEMRWSRVFKPANAAFRRFYVRESNGPLPSSATEISPPGTGWDWVFSAANSVSRALILIPTLCYMVLFFPARFFFMAECVINLMFAPPRVFQLPSWVPYIPHVA